MSSPGNPSEIVQNFPTIMPDAWPVFFRRRFPRPIQIESMPYIVRGESALLCGPTASGKTEAVVAPLYQRHVSFRRNKLSVVHIAPTKALVNDLFFRLNDYLESLSPGLVTRYTGDHHDFTSPEGVFILLTTPEALDSLQLTRPDQLTSIRALVVDEIHLLHGSPRGQQLRYVMKRLEVACDQPQSPKDLFQIVGMTATIGDIEDVKRIWIGDWAKSIKTGDARDIDMIYLAAHAEDLSGFTDEKAESIAKWVKENNPRKVLVFGNSRNMTHAMAAALHDKLKESRWPVYLHIGILHATERVRVECAMKNDRFGVCVATSTLEVGIDIGDIDVIVLAEPPFSVYAFLQRIGRGNRNSDVCRVVAVHTDEQERTIFRALHHCACSGLLDDVHDYDRPSIRFQQVLSLAWRGVRTDSPVTEANIVERTGGFYHKDVIEDMLTTGALREIGAVLIPNDKLMDQGDKRRIHTTIVGAIGVPMIDIDSGEVVGYTSGNALDSGAIYIGGKMKKVVQSADGQIYIEPLKEDEKRYLTRLPSTRIRRGLSRRIVWSIGELGGFNPKRWIRDKDHLLTWGGAKFNLLLRIVLKKTDVAKNTQHDDFGLKGLPKGLHVDPKLLYEWANEIWESNDISVDEAFQFCDRTRYLGDISRKMQIVEAINSIPFPSFLKWLKECDRLVDQVT
ncbi:MAG: DEAD/DEAH box helicase [Deltaproteobacteria bacterium]|nr:DEAD/DEAH box helicase [Deltaproteobacteria bacterium]